MDSKIHLLRFSDESKLVKALTHESSRDAQIGEFRRQLHHNVQHAEFDPGRHGEIDAGLVVARQRGRPSGGDAQSRRVGGRRVVDGERGVAGREVGFFKQNENEFRQFYIFF